MTKIVETKKRGILVIILLSALAVIFSAGFWYYEQLQNKIYETTVANMQELAAHDQKSIMADIERSWNDLEAIHFRMERYDIDTLQKLQQQLNVEQNSSFFEKVYYMAEDGRLYSGDYMIMSYPELCEPLQNGAERFVMRYDNIKAIIVDYKKEYLVYGIQIEPWQVEDKVFTGIVCQASIDSLESVLIINSYNGQGYSSIIDMEGNYIVNLNRNQSMFLRENFFERLEQGHFLNNRLSVHDIRQKITEKENFMLLFQDKAGKDKVLVFQKIADLDWYFILVVSNDVFLHQSSKLMQLSMVAICIITITVLAIVVLIYNMLRNSIRAKSQLEARSEFLSNMSHEIRTPLNGLIGLNHLMVENIDSKEKIIGYLQKSTATAQYLLMLVNDILDLSKIQAGRVDLNPTPVNLQMLLDNVASMQRTNMEKNQLNFILDFDLSAPCIVCDDVRVKQILMNLLSNAGKFTPAGGDVTLKAWQKEAVDGKVETHFEVIDTGCGMSKEFCTHIFETFTQERSKNNNSQKGTGLGMAISHHLVEAMGGTITVESELGKGSRFCVTFTAEITDKAIVNDTFLTQGIVREDLEMKKGLYLLVAEDNELNAEILLEILMVYDHIQADLAVNGQEAVERFAASEIGMYDAILMDIQMPIMDGYEATRRIRALDRADAATVKIMACTANTFQSDNDMALASGMDDFLGKPIDVVALLQKLSQI